MTHDARGYPVMEAGCHDDLVRRLCDKIRNNADEIAMLEEDGLDDCEVVVVSYGITSRVARAAVDTAVTGLKSGAFDYLLKPADFDELTTILAGAKKKKAEQDERIRKAEARQLLRRGGNI